MHPLSAIHCSTSVRLCPVAQTVLRANRTRVVDVDGLHKRYITTPLSVILYTAPLPCRLPFVPLASSHPHVRDPCQSPASRSADPRGCCGTPSQTSRCRGEPRVCLGGHDVLGKDSIGGAVGDSDQSSGVVLPSSTVGHLAQRSVPEITRYASESVRSPAFPGRNSLSWNRQQVHHPVSARGHLVLLLLCRVWYPLPDSERRSMPVGAQREPQIATGVPETLRLRPVLGRQAPFAGCGPDFSPTPDNPNFKKRKPRRAAKRNVRRDVLVH